MNIAVFLLFTLMPGISAGGCSSDQPLGVRNAHALAYDSDRGRVLLFGGADERQVMGDLWGWDGKRWDCLSNVGPPPRTFPSLAYNPATKRLVLFGGNRVLFGTEEDTETFLGDMWTWDGQSWSQIEAATPSPRAEAAMVYDSARQRIVLFGGYRNADGERIRLGDTWEWDGQRWEARNVTGPSPRNGASMAFDVHREKVVLFGGSGAMEETWEWDGATWERIPAGTGGRFNSAMAYDVARRTLLRFGGWTPQGRRGDTWKWDGKQWALLTQEGPQARNHTSLAYDSQNNVIVLYGGHDGQRVFGDTWEWDGSQWILKTRQPPLMRVDNGH